MNEFINGTSIDFKEKPEWKRAYYESGRSYILTLCKEYVTNGRELDLSDLPQPVQDAINDCFKLRHEDIRDAVLQESFLQTTGLNLVENIDWKVKWVLGSSKLSLHKEVLLQLDLNCVQANDKCDIVRNCVTCEVDKEQLDKLIANLEEVKIELENKCNN